MVLVIDGKGDDGARVVFVAPESVAEFLAEQA